MNFTIDVKKELIFNKMNKQQTISFLSGIFFSNVVNNNEDIKIKLMNNEIFEKFKQMMKEMKIDFQELSKNQVIVKNKWIKQIDSKYASNFFAGIFLSSGSISNLNSSSYHLEINFKNENNCDQIIEFAKKHILFNKIKNKNYFVLYLKKNESISDFLQIIHAQKSYFIFIDSIIERDFKNQITRIFNLDVHNQNRLVDSNQIFIENLNYVKKNNLVNKFSKEQLDFYEYKKNNEFLSLSQLSDSLKKISINKTKSGLNHWLIKLRNVVEEHQNQIIKQKREENK